MASSTEDPLAQYAATHELTPEMKTELKEAMSKPYIKHSDMKSDDQSDAMDLIISSIEKNMNNYELAAKQIKETMDKKFGTHWHCIIGEGFGFEVTHQTDHILFVYYNALAVLLYKGGTKPEQITLLEPEQKKP